jgi:hypothetical protein
MAGLRSRSMGNKQPPKESSCISGAESNCGEKWLFGLIGKTLRAEYDAVTQEPLPDRLTDLIRQLDESERQKSNGSPAEPSGQADKK